MSVLPIVDRELRVASRRSGTYWLRFWAALATLVVWLVLLKGSNNITAGQMGHHLLNAIGILALVFSMLAGVFLTSDCLSEEKREGTLGLLFLTDLKAYDVVFGKLAANSLHAIFGLLSVFPILGLAILIGGVTGPEFARLMLVFLVTLFFSLSMGMVVSAISREAKQAVTNAFLLLLIFAGVCPALWWLSSLVWHRGAFDFLLWPSPAYAYMMGFDQAYGYKMAAYAFWHSIETLTALAVGGIIFANVVLPRSWREVSQAPSAKARSRWRRLFSKPVMLNFRVSGGWTEPMFWLAVRDGSPRSAAKRMLWLLVPVWLGILVTSISLSKQTSRIQAFVTSFVAAYGLHLLVKVLIATEAGRRMNQDRRSGAWELLLVTPLEVDAILRGQKRALNRLFFPAILTLCLVNFAMMETVLWFSQRLQMQERDAFLFCEMFSGGMLTLVTDFYGLSWLGMWRGLNAKQHHRAVLATLGQIMGAPLLYFFFLVFTEPRVGDTGVRNIMASWFLLGAIVSMVSGMKAKWRLQQEFRSAVLGAHATGAVEMAGGGAA